MEQNNVAGTPTTPEPLAWLGRIPIIGAVAYRPLEEWQQAFAPRYYASRRPQETRSHNPVFVASRTTTTASGQSREGI